MTACVCTIGGFSDVCAHRIGQRSFSVPRWEVGSAGPQSYGKDPRFALFRTGSACGMPLALRHRLRSSPKLKGIDAYETISASYKPRPYREPQARAKWKIRVPKSSESRQAPAQSSLEILEAPGRGAGGLEQGCRGCRKQVCRVPAAGFAGEVPGPELASKARNAELELAQRGQRQLSAQLGHLARLGQGPPGPPGPRAVPAAPNPHPHALPVGTVGTGPPANLSVNGLPPAHPFAYPFEGPKTKTVPGNIGFGLQTTPTPMPATAGERLGHLGPMSSLSSRHDFICRRSRLHMLPMAKAFPRRRLGSASPWSAEC